MTTVLLARGWLLVPAVAALLLALTSVVPTRAPRWVAPLTAVLGVQVVLRWPPTLFHGFPTTVAAALVVICAVPAWRRASHRQRRWTGRLLGAVLGLGVILAVPFVIASLSTRTQVLRGQAEARTALSDVGTSDTNSVVAELGRAASDTHHTAGVMGSWMTTGARAVPVLAQQERFLVGTLQAASTAAVTGRREAPAIDYRPGYQPGQVDVARLRAIATPLGILDHQLRSTGTELAGVTSPWLVAPLQDRANSYRRQLTQAAHSASLGVAAARVLPGMLGVDGIRHYLIAFMTPSESRGYDGLVASYGLLTADSGHITLTASGDVDQIENALPSGGATLTGVPQYLARYGSFNPGKFPEDATYAPDLPTDADVLSQIYAQSAGGGPVDGVLAIDPYGLAALLHFTGPIHVPGLPSALTSANAAKVLLTTEYKTFDTGTPNQDFVRHAILQSALQAAFHALVNRSLPTPKDFSTVLDPAAAAGRISFWSFHRAEQPFLRDLGIDGSFPRADGGDLLAVTAQNTGNNKIDAYLHTSITDHVTFDPGTSSVTSAVNVTLTNDAPAAGLPAEVIDSPADPGLPPGTNETWLTLYSPLSFDHITIDGTAATLSAMRELGVWAYSTYVEVAPGTSVTVRVGLLGTVAAGSTLRLAVRLQPSANPVRAKVIVAPSGPWLLATTKNDTQWDMSSAMRQTRIFRFIPK